MKIKGILKQEIICEVTPVECINNLLKHYGFATKCKSTFDGFDWIEIRDNKLYYGYQGESYASTPKYILITEDQKLIKLYSALSEAQSIIKEIEK